MPGQPFRPRNIWCVGWNYADHAKELNNDVPARPVIFLKSGSCKISTSQHIVLPQFSNCLHYEVELAIELNSKLQPDRGAVALDLTARDVQNAAKQKGEPWTLAKSFKGSCPIGPAFDLTGLDLQNLELRLVVNGQPRQIGNTKQMVHTVASLVDFVCEHFPVEAGDVVLTGTPPGVGALLPGDHVDAQVTGVGGSPVHSKASWRVTVTSATPAYSHL